MIKSLIRPFVVAAASIALLAGGTGPALAAPAAPGAARVIVHDWYEFDRIDSRWHCDDTVDRGTYYEQTCTIVNGRNHQGALIFVAKESAGYAAKIHNVKNGVFGRSRECMGWVVARIRVACFSPTDTADGGDYVQARFVDPHNHLMWSPTVQVP